MRQVKTIIAVLVLVTFVASVKAERFVLQATAPIAWKEYDALAEYLNKSGECAMLSRYGQSPHDFPHLYSVILKRFNDHKTRQYVPLFVYSCMISGDPEYGYYIPSDWVKKMPSY